MSTDSPARSPIVTGLAQRWLVHEMLFQIRVIKLILTWVLVIIPVVATTVLAVLAKAEAPEYDPYPYRF